VCRIGVRPSIHEARSRFHAGPGPDGLSGQRSRIRNEFRFGPIAPAWHWRAGYGDTTVRLPVNLFRRLLHDESGGEIIEWALVVGLVIVAAITTVAAFGTKVLGRRTSVNDSM